MVRTTIRALALLTLVGCGDIIGLSGYTDGVDDGGSEGSAAGDTGLDMATADVVVKDGTGDVTDAPPADSCVPKAEDCTNGLDDDCNGAVDCADSACTTGFSCVPPLPMGWTWSAYDQDQRPACAANFSSPKDVAEGVNAAAATCGCGCTTSNPSCVTGNVAITAGSGGNCSTVNTQNSPAAAGCNVTNPNFATNNQSISVTGPAPSGGSCAANPSKTVPSITYQHQGRTCDYTGTIGMGCMNGNVCAPTPAPFVSCVSQTGMQACPNGFPVQHLVGATLADTRDCSACTCSFSAGTCTGTATFYGDSACTNNATTFNVDGACHAVSNRTWRGYRYMPTNNASCMASASSATGMAVFSDLETVCCTN